MDTNMRAAVGYEEDEYAWLLQQAELLAEQRLHEIDYEHLSAFLTDMARSDRNALRSRLVVLVAHIMKCKLQPERVSRSWAVTLLAQQDAIQNELETSATLARIAEELLQKILPAAAKQAEAATGLSAKALTSGFSLQEVLAFTAEPTRHPSAPED